VSDPKPGETLFDGLMLEHLVADDPWGRFIDFLPNDPPMRERDFARETEKLRRELEQHVVIMFQAYDDSCLESANWVAANASGITWRWRCLVKTYQRWSQLDCPPLAFKVKR
jgi:hypothetical protein